MGIKVKDVKRGEYITLKPIVEPKESQVWVRDEYDRSERKYLIYKFADIGVSRLIAGDREVFTDFVF